MKSQVKWIDRERFLGVTSSNNSVVMDADKTAKTAPSPMEMILMGLGGCASVDVVGILQKARQEIVGCCVEIEAERADSVPAVFTRIHLKFVVSGRNISESHLQRAVQLSADKYCSASTMLGKGGVEITYSHEVEESD